MTLPAPAASVRTASAAARPGRLLGYRLAM